MPNIAPTTAELVFKVASEDWEFEQIHRLNYRTFVEEIPQHASNPEGRLVDRFHAENTYIICLQGRRLVGMLALLWWPQRRRSRGDSPPPSPSSSDTDLAVIHP